MGNGSSDNLEEHYIGRLDLYYTELQSRWVNIKVIQLHEHANLWMVIKNYGVFCVANNWRKNVQKYLSI